MRLDVSVYTNRGGREINEDSVRWGVRDGSGFFTVADGLGGCGSGEVSSDLAAHALLKAWEDNSVKPQERAAWLEEAIRAAIQEVVDALGIDKPTGKDKGRIMKELMPKVKGKADGALVNKLVGETLA